MTEKYVPDIAELIDCYAAHMEEHAGEPFREAQADAERGIKALQDAAWVKGYGSGFLDLLLNRPEPTQNPHEEGIA